MKISQKQASLLAKEVLKQLKKAKVGDVPKEMIEKIKMYKTKRAELLATCKIHDEAFRKHEDNWRSLVGAAADEKVYATDRVETIIDKLKERDVPPLSVIEDEIILQSMFASDDDMQTFVNKLVKKFEKKTRPKNTILNN